MKCFVLLLAMLARRWLKTLAVVGTVLSLVVALYAPAAATTVAYYRFEEGSADSKASGIDSIIDSSTYGNDGTPYGTYDPIYRSDVPVNPVPLTGASNTLSLQFAGIDSYVEVVNPANLRDPADPNWILNFGSGSFTVECWFKLDALDRTFSRLLSKFYWESSTGSHGWILSTGADANTDNVQWGVGAGGANSGTVTSGDLAAGVWYHIAGVFDHLTGTSSLYLDGVLQGSVSALHENVDYNLGIGTSFYDAGWGYDRFFYGHIDEVRISDAALSPSEFLNVPEPTTIVLMGCGLFGLLVVVIRQRRKGK